MKLPARLTFALIFCFVLIGSSVPAENWPQWRGPRGDGTSLETGIATEWGPDKNVVWKTELATEDRSSPIIWDDMLFLTSASADGHQRKLMRFDAKTGKLVWEKVVLEVEAAESIHAENSYASTTPCTDGEHIYSTWEGDGKVHIIATDLDGNEVWSDAPLAFKVMHGFSSSPLLHDGMVIFNCYQETEPAIMAYDAKTGDQVWRHDYLARSGSYSTPLIREVDGKPQLLTAGMNFVHGIEPTTGKVLWKQSGPTLYVVANIVYGDGILLVHGGYPMKKIMAIQPGSESSKQKVIWNTRKGGSYVPSPIYYEGHMYTVLDNGIATCMEAKTGEELWKERVGGKYRTSLVLVGENLYTTNDAGLTTIFKASPDGLEVVAKNDLAEFTYASPAISGGRLFLRTGKHLYCIDE